MLFVNDLTKVVIDVTEDVAGRLGGGWKAVSVDAPATPPRKTTTKKRSNTRGSRSE